MTLPVELEQPFEDYLKDLGWYGHGVSRTKFGKGDEAFDIIAVEGDHIWIKDRENFAYTPASLRWAVKDRKERCT